MFQANHEDAYDSDVDEGPNAAVAFMANLSSTSATNNLVNEVRRHLDSDAETEIDDTFDPYLKYLLDIEAQNMFQLRNVAPMLSQTLEGVECTGSLKEVITNSGASKTVPRRDPRIHSSLPVKSGMRRRHAQDIMGLVISVLRLINFVENVYWYCGFGIDEYAAIRWLSDNGTGVCEYEQSGSVGFESVVFLMNRRLFFAKAPLLLWAEAVATEVLYINRSLVHTLQGRTYYELLKGKKPNLQYSECLDLCVGRFVHWFDDVVVVTDTSGSSDNLRGHVYCMPRTRDCQWFSFHNSYLRRRSAVAEKSLTSSTLKPIQRHLITNLYNIDVSPINQLPPCKVTQAHRLKTVLDKERPVSSGNSYTRAGLRRMQEEINGMKRLRLRLLNYKAFADADYARVVSGHKEEVLSAQISGMRSQLRDYGFCSTLAFQDIDISSPLLKEQALTESAEALCKTLLPLLGVKQSQPETSFQGNSCDLFLYMTIFQNQASTSGTLPSNTIPNPKGEMKAITTRSGVAYEGPSIPTNPSPKKVVERETEETTDKEQTNFQGSTAHIQPLVNPIPISEPDVPKTLPKPNIPYPSRLNDQKLREKATNQMEKFFQIFQDLHFDISFADALLLMPKFASTIKSLLTNKDKLFELAKIPLNENCSAMLLKKLPEKLGDPGKFLIPCDFPGMDVCHALADLGASINLMPLSIWKKLSLPELTPTRMTLELADRSITRPKGVAEDVFVKVGKFHFPTDFVVVDFEADPRVPLILGRSFLRTGRALIDVYGEEITLRVNDEAVTFNLNQTTRYSSTYDDMSVNRIDVIDVACEEYAQEVLGFSNKSMGGNPIPTIEPFIFDSSLSLTPFEGSDFILEEIEAYLKDDLISPEIDHADFDPEGDIFLIERLLNNDPFQLHPMDLMQVEVTKVKSSIKEPPELELKDLPSYLEYAYLEGIDKLPVIIAKGLKDDEKEALLKVLKSHKWAIA
ncbi:reverse transcriptase domain-containing protein [Tanacetum coccineum]|uniref:Reverse transcriptase domain-containing protein n=1 Tax=Tanacetum coccineum TaxID=301880 RepID=A0ABQ5EUE7_9ASTR